MKFLFTNRIKKMLLFLCGEEQNGKINRASFWTMFAGISALILLIIAFRQLHDVNETTAAEFAHKVKNDLFTADNLYLISLFDDNVMIFKLDTTNGNVVWFQVDTDKYKMIPLETKCTQNSKSFNIFEIDVLIQEFEDLAFYEKKGQITMDYIYDQYAYYIEMLWENVEMKKYIEWQRKQPHCEYTYINFERMYNRLKILTDKER